MKNYFKRKHRKITAINFVYINNCTFQNNALATLMLGTATSPRPHCRVLPPGEFNGIIPEPLFVYSECLKTIAIIFYNGANKNMVANNKAEVNCLQSKVLICC